MFVLGIVQHISLNYHLRSWDGVFSPVISERRNSRFRFVKYHNIFRTHQNTEGFRSFLNMCFSSQKALCDFQGSYRHQHGRVFSDSSQRWSCCGLWHAPCERIWRWGENFCVLRMFFVQELEKLNIVTKEYNWIQEVALQHEYVQETVKSWQFLSFDSCKIKKNSTHRFSVSQSKMSTLVTTWCSKASLKQRRGRTGRTCDGRCYKMFERRWGVDKGKFDMKPGTWWNLMKG